MKTDFGYGRIEIDKKLLFHQAFYHTPSLLAQSAYFYVLGAGHFVCHKDFHLKRKEYKCYLLKYTLEGSGILVYRGKQYVLGKNQILLLDCMDYHEYYTGQDSTWENKWVHFNGGMSAEYFNILYQNYGPVIDMPENCKIPQYIDSLMEWMQKEDRLFEIKASPVILGMLTEIMISFSTEPGSLSRSGEKDYLENALEFIEKNYSCGISIQDIARSAQLSVFHFSRLFKKAIGFTPYEYLVKYRMNKAKFLLSHTQLPVEEIAYQVGFEDASAFIRTFKKLEGITPLKYRNHII